MGVAYAGKKNIFSGRILEIEGLPDLTCEQVCVKEKFIFLSFDAVFDTMLITILKVRTSTNFILNNSKCGTLAQ